MTHNTPKTLWTRIRENLAAMAYAARVGRAFENGEITLDQARVLMTGSSEREEPRVVRVDRVDRVDVAAMAAAELRTA